MLDNSSFCLGCKRREKCKVICKRLEKTLPKERSGGHKKEKSIDPQIIDKLNPEGKLRGYQVKPHIYNDNWERD